MYKVKCNIIIEVETTFDDAESNSQTVAYLIEDDLREMGWNNIKVKVEE